MTQHHHQSPHTNMNRFDNLGNLTAHHGLAELDLRQPTLPDEAAILGTVGARKSVTVTNVGETPPPKYESEVDGVSELPDGERRQGRGHGHARAWSEPDPSRPELDGRVAGGPAAGRWSTPARAGGVGHRYGSSDASELDSRAQYVQHGRYPSATSNASELDGRMSTTPAPEMDVRAQQQGQGQVHGQGHVQGQGSGYQLHQPLQAYYEMPEQRYE